MWGKDLRIKKIPKENMNEMEVQIDRLLYRNKEKVNNKAESEEK